MVILISYKFITYLITKSEKIEIFLEGKAIYIVHDGHAALESIHHTDLAMDEFFAELRVLNIQHLGQMKEALLETACKYTFMKTRFNILVFLFGPKNGTRRLK